MRVLLNFNRVYSFTAFYPITRYTTFVQFFQRPNVLSLVERFINPVSNEQKNIQLLERIYMNKNALLWLPRLFQIVKVFFHRPTFPEITGWDTSPGQRPWQSSFNLSPPLLIFLNANVTMQNNIERDEREGGGGGSSCSGGRVSDNLITFCSSEGCIMQKQFHVKISLKDTDRCKLQMLHAQFPL